MPWTHLKDTMPVARKQHECWLCGKVIEKGVKHIRRRGVCGNKHTSDRMHIECDARTKDWDDIDWGTFSRGTLELDDD